MMVAVEVDFRHINLELEDLCFFLFFVEFTFFFGGGILVLLVFRDQIVHVRFSFSEFHFVHTLTYKIKVISLFPVQPEVKRLFYLPVYQWRKAFLLNMAVNCSLTRLKSSWMAVELPMKVADIFKPRGGISQTAVLTLFGIHSTKYEEFLFWMLSICSSTSFMDIRPRNMVATVR